MGDTFAVVTPRTPPRRAQAAQTGSCVRHAPVRWRWARPAPRRACGGSFRAAEARSCSRPPPSRAPARISAPAPPTGHALEAAGNSLRVSPGPHPEGTRLRSHALSLCSVHNAHLCSSGAAPEAFGTDPSCAETLRRPTPSTPASPSKGRPRASWPPRCSMLARTLRQTCPAAAPPGRSGPLR